MKLLDNPFYILKCLPESSKTTILEQADNRSFDIDEHICNDAKNILFNPRKRLEAEISWFPGFSPNLITEKINKIINNFQDYISNFFFDKTNFYLAESNLLAFGFEIEKDLNKWSEDNIRLASFFLCSMTEKINIDQTKNLIENSRKTANFPSNLEKDEINYFINIQKEYYKNCLFNFFQKINSEKLISILTKLIEEATEKGEQTCKWSLLEEIIYEYENDTKPFFEKQETLINNDIEIILNSLTINKKFIKQSNEYSEKLKEDLKNLYNISYPIKLLKKSRGIDDENLLKIAYAVRLLYIKAANDFADYEFAIKINQLCLEYFSEIRKISDVLQTDKIDLFGLLNQTNQQKRKIEEEMILNLEWTNEKGEEHSVNTDTDSITIDNLNTYKLSEINQIKWGFYIDQYIIFFKTPNIVIPASITTKSNLDYLSIIKVLWEKSGKLILEKYVNDLKKAKTIKIGELVIHDYGMELIDRGWVFSSVKMFPWKDIKSVNKEEDSMIIEGPDNYKLNFPLSTEYNAYVIYEILRLFFKYGKGVRISDTIEKNYYTI